MTPRLLALAIGIAVGLTAFAGASLVAAQRGEPVEPPSAASYLGWVNNHTGVLRIVGEGEQCQDHEMSIQFGGSAGDAALLERIEELESEVETLRAQVPECLSTEGTEVYFTGCNVNIRNGDESETTTSTNGLGNLIVGYNESNDDARTGSHNLVIGSRHSFSSYGGLVAGENNAVNGVFSSVTGGQSAIADGPYSSISGGLAGQAIGRHSSISGGQLNTARAPPAASAAGTRTPPAALSQASAAGWTTPPAVTPAVSGAVPPWTRTNPMSSCPKRPGGTP